MRSKTRHERRFIVGFSLLTIVLTVVVMAIPPKPALTADTTEKQGASVDPAFPGRAGSPSRTAGWEDDDDRL